MQLSIKTNFPDVQRQLEGLRKDVATKATGRSLNRTMEQARTQMVRRITAEYDIKAGKVREKLRINRARLTGGLLELEASLESQTKGGRRSVNVINFSPRKVAGGVTIKVRRNGQRRLIRGAFIANKGREDPRGGAGGDPRALPGDLPARSCLRAQPLGCAMSRLNWLAGPSGALLTRVRIDREIRLFNEFCRGVVR